MTMKKALCIGINNYPTAPLHGCINDATAVAELLSKNGDGSNNFSAMLATGIRTESELRSQIIKLFEGDIPDIALLYFSGHGHVNQFGGYLLTPDAKQYNEGLPMEDVLTLANNSKIKNKIIILDCCHAGAIGGDNRRSGVTQAINNGITIISSSGEAEKSKEQGGHGLFTSLLLDGLKGGAADILGNITPGSIYTYIDKALGPWDQRPVFKTNVSQFISLRNIPSQVPITVLRKIADYFPELHYEYP
jgi:Caspase domain